MRLNNRENYQLRPIKIIREYTKYAEGSVFITCGDTQILCNASIEEGVPRFLRGQSQGWITAEYSMLPRATNLRNIRESIKGKQNGRTMEIQRLIARSLRAAVNLKQLGEYTIILDCDVIQADGGTRTAAISGSCIALKDALNKMVIKGKLKQNPMKYMIAAVSVGLVNGQPVCDLEYNEDYIAETDMNIVMTENDKIIEIQGSAERAPFSYEDLLSLIYLAKKCLQIIFIIQKQSLEQ